MYLCQGTGSTVTCCAQAERFPVCVHEATKTGVAMALFLHPYGGVPYILLLPLLSLTDSGG